jgi:poly(3-hydroxybutyrate) depolymerase
MKKVAFIFCLVFLFSKVVFAECLPQSKTQIVKQRGYFVLSGNPANFDPCHSSVEFKTGRNLKEKKPLVIGVGGGGGKNDAKGAMAFFRDNGFATLEFDPYEMNGISDYKQNIRAYSNPTRQRMIFPIAVGAVEWALKQDVIDNTRIYVWGISNGATVVANIAALFDKKQVKAVFAEAPTNAGMGMPDNLKTSLVLIFGKKDNYGSIKKDGWRWLDTTPCFKSISIVGAPTGNTTVCNSNSNRQSFTENHNSWFEKQKNKKADIQIWFYEDAAHGIFNPRLDWNSTRTTPTGVTFYSNEGATNDVKEKYKKDLLKYIGNQK